LNFNQLDLFQNIQMGQKKSLYAYFISCFFIFSLVMMYPRWNDTGPNATLSWDVMGYYTYLPASLIYNDLGELKFRDSIQKKYRPTGLDHAGYLHESGKQVMKYPMGMALAYAPWFGLAHITAKVTGQSADGFSVLYHSFVTFGCLIYAFIGLWFLRKILLRYFSDGVSAITLLLIALGTNYLNYSAFDMAMPHNFLFTLYAILTWYSIKWYERPTFKNSIVIGICIGWAALARPTEIVAAMIPVLWGIYNWESIRERFSFWKKHFGKIVLSGAVVIAIGFLQLLYWKIITGDFLVYSYQDQGFSWDGRHLKNCFFSYRKGWLMYTPLMTFAIIGLFFLWRKFHNATANTITKVENPFFAVFIFFLINTFIIFSWDVWWYGGGFGQRAMIPSYALLALPLAALLEFVSKSFLGKICLAIPILFCSWLNMHQTWQAHAPGGGFETENMTKAYYWKIFGKTNVDPELRIFLDTDEEFTGDMSKAKSIYSNDFETFTDSIFYNSKFSRSGNHSIYLSNENQYSPVFSTPLSSSSEAKWVRATADFYLQNKEWNFWMMTQFIISLEQGDQPIKHKMIRVHRLLKDNNWRRIAVDIKVPKDQSFDNVKVKFWNAGGTKEIWVDDLMIEVLRDER